MIVMKFGGTSVEDSAAVRRLIEIVRSKLDEKPIIVVSALSKVTHSLYQIADYASRGDFESADTLLSDIEERHVKMSRELISNDKRRLELCVGKIGEQIAGLREIIKVISILAELSDRSLAKIVSHGELLSSHIIYHALNESGIRCAYADARECIITDSQYLKGEPDLNLIKERVPEYLNKQFADNETLIIQGFIASSTDGVNTTLGRGGSDYSASLIGLAMGAKEIEIWTDVDGIHTADPGRVANTRSISLLSFEEAAEMAYFGAKVLHPSTIQPAIEKNIPVRVLNSRKPEHKGTLILHRDLIKEDGIKAISFKENIIVINVFSTKMLNYFGFLNRLFEVFNKHKVSVDLISTSEVNVSLTIDSETGLNRIIEELSLFSEVNVERNMSQISVVGRNLKNIKGVCKRVFGSLGDYQIYMISQGASDVNISFVVGRENLTSVLRILHNEFFNE